MKNSVIFSNFFALALYFFSLDAQVKEVGDCRINFKGQDFCDIDVNINNDREALYAGLFDGHGGKKIAQSAARDLKTIFKSALIEYPDTKAALDQSFMNLDKRLYDSQKALEKCQGSTALVAYIQNEHLYISNLGDSRAVLCSKGKAVPLSNDHNALNQDEVIRVRAQGGAVNEKTHRIDGCLLTSRALGDFFFKDYEHNSFHVERCPETKEYCLREDDSFLILASDGLWDVVDNQIAVSQVEAILEKHDAGTAAYLLSQWALRKRSNLSLSPDDITVIIVVFEASVSMRLPQVQSIELSFNDVLNNSSD